MTLTRLRSDDGLEPATHVIFASAMALASAPRAYVRLLALNTGRWPRGISEDRLIPDHVMQIDELDPLPIADADRRDFATIVAAAKSVTASFSRRDVEGRLLGRSPLVTSIARKCSSGATIPPPSGEVGDPRLDRGEPGGGEGQIRPSSRHPPPDRRSLRSGGRPPPRGRGIAFGFCRPIAKGCEQDSEDDSRFIGGSDGQTQEYFRRLRDPRAANASYPLLEIFRCTGGGAVRGQELHATCPTLVGAR